MPFILEKTVKVFHIPFIVKIENMKGKKGVRELFFYIQKF